MTGDQVRSVPAIQNFINCPQAELGLRFGKEGEISGWK
jgi:hypothetical protein